MKLIDWKQKWKDKWLLLTIKKKLRFVVAMVFLIMFLSFLFNVWVVNFSINDFGMILEDNARNSEFMDAIETEINCFSEYIKSPSEEKRVELERVCNQTYYALLRLPYNYKIIGEYRYAKTWSIRNSYEVYKEKRDYVLNISEENLDYIKELYNVYNMQGFQISYAKTLMTYTLKEGTLVYNQKVPYLKGVPIIFLIFSTFLVLCFGRLGRLMSKSIISPIVELVYVTKKIAASDFEVEDVKVENRDEMGDLVKAFNKMKKETSQYIRTLEEKRKIVDLLHKEEMEKIEVEKQLEIAKFDLLKNQIQPHFLFNTLNIISGMARLEDAKTTDKMIKAMSAIFRYNLKTPEIEVTLEQELRVIKEYMYLQQMRFGSRIQYQMECLANAEAVYVPTFSIQPLIENAIIHGLSKKEEGGKIYIRIWSRQQEQVISIADTGMGMPSERLEQIRKSLIEDKDQQNNIGLRNINKRMQAMYPTSKVEIYSKENVGTVVQLIISSGEEEKKYV